MDISNGYTEKYKQLINIGIKSSEKKQIANCIAFKLYALPVIEFMFAKMTEDANNTTIPLIDKQATFNALLRSDNVLLNDKVEKIL